MDKPVSELTYKVVAYSEIRNFEWDDCIDWAYEMMLLGYDTPDLAMLAGTGKPTDSFEVRQYLTNILAELGIEQKKGEDADIIYCSYFVREIARGKDVRSNVSKLKELSNELEGTSVEYFRSLYWAWEDLDRELECQHYWEGATKENIEQIIVDEANNWLKEYEARLYLWSPE